jgi:uncharacterized SAM-binding protein YcdF (DUF218 family)
MPSAASCSWRAPTTTFQHKRMQSSSWNEIIVVTSRFHLFRTRILFKRCNDATLTLRGAPEPWYRHFFAIPSEWLKLVVAETTRRPC